MKGLELGVVAFAAAGANRADRQLVNKVMSAVARILCAGLLLVQIVSSAAAGAPERWLLVDSSALTLTLMRGDRPQLTLDNIAVGRFGTSLTKLRGDNTTPLGRFRIDRVNQKSAFYRFISLNYPDVARAEQALREEEIDAGELRAIQAAHRGGKLPPQGTVLGGRIGIHGLGKADAEMHASLNWTRGCVALTNEQIDALLPWIRAGMLVEIR